MKLRPPILWTVAVTALVMGAGAAFVSLGSRNRAAEEEAHRKQTAAAAALTLERRLGTSLAAVYPAAERLRRGDDFGTPGGAPSKVTKSVPVDGWLIARDRRTLEVRGVELTPATLESLTAAAGQPAPLEWPNLWGPYRTTDGRWAVVITVPPPAPDRGMSEGRAAWIGATVLVDRLLSASDVPQLAQAGFDYELSAAHPVTGQPQVISRSSEFGLIAPVTQAVQVANDVWTLAVGSRTASTGEPWHGWVAAVLVVVLTLAAGLLTYDVSSRAEHLQEELAKRQQRLSTVNRRLMDEIQQRADVEQQFAHASFHDAVTGLPNRRYFTNRVNRALYHLRRQPGAFVAIVVLGFDRFKNVNDTFGYAAGDELLKQAARRIEDCTRPADLALARVGVDEFALLLQGLSDAGAATMLAERLQDTLANPFEIEKETVFATVSVGIAVRSSGYAEADEIIREADIALSRAKTEGRARHAIFEPRAREEVVTLQQLETDLHRAIEHDELRLYYQPIVSLQTGRIAGLEALLRWNHPRQGLVAPGYFIRAAETSELIVPISRWALRQAAAQAREWRGQLPKDIDFYLSVNLSGHDLKEQDLCHFVEGLLRETELPSGVLRLEVTESVLIEDVKGANDLVAGLRRIGVPLLLDDFGTGYSSLSYLDRFRVDYLKIDQAFVRRVTPMGPDRRILKAIIHLAEDLGIGSIAEGVETAEDVSLLAGLKCGYAQGYYFSKPVPAAKAEELLRSGHYSLSDVRTRGRTDRLAAAL